MHTKIEILPKIKKRSIQELIKSFLLAAVLAIGFRSFLFEPYKIPSGSMKPTLIVGDFIFVSKYYYGYSKYSFPFSPDLFEGRKIIFNKPERGEIIVFRHPKNPNINYVKRLIGLPGDKIQLINGAVYLNDTKVEDQDDGLFVDTDNKAIDKLIETLPNGKKFNILQADKNGELDNTPVYNVPEGHYFFMGDNRDNSIDSRVLDRVGFVPFENFIGRAEIIFFSTTASFIKPWEWVTKLNPKRVFSVLTK